VATTGGDRCLRALYSEHGDRVGGKRRGSRKPVRVVRNRLGPLIGGPGLVTNFFQISNSAQICKFKMEAFLYSKNIQILYAAILDYFQQLSQLGRLQIINIIDAINFRKEFNLKLL
jgi:hypothetical protein